jgi:hypothetical protein
MAVVRNIFSPQRTGLEFPLPGIAVFQRTFSVSLHLVGASPTAIPSAAIPLQ